MRRIFFVVMFSLLPACKSPSFKDAMLAQINLHRVKPVYEPSDSSICQDSSLFVIHTCRVNINMRNIVNNDGTLKNDITYEVIEKIVSSCREKCPECFDSRMDRVCINYDSSGVMLSFVDLSDVQLKVKVLKNENMKSEDRFSKKNIEKAETEMKIKLNTIHVSGKAYCINPIDTLRCNLIGVTPYKLKMLHEAINALKHLNSNTILVLNVKTENPKADTTLYYHYSCNLSDFKKINLLKLNKMEMNNRLIYLYRDARKPSIWIFNESGVEIEFCDSLSH